MTTLLERKAMNALIRIAKDQLKRNEQTKVFYCKLGLIKRLSGIKDSSNLGLKKTLISLNKTNFEYNVLNKDKNKWGVFSFLAEASITEQGRGQDTIVSFEFPSTVLDVIRHPNIYVKLNMYILMGLESKHSMALYEHIKDYEKIKSLRCQIDLFRKIMGLKEGQYEIFTMLKKRVLDTAVSEINEKTDKALTYELEREGRKIVAIVFHFGNAVV